LADTHVLIWLMEGGGALGRGTRNLIDEALGGDVFGVSAVSFWEVAMLAEKGRIGLKRAPAVWRRVVLDLGVAEIPLTGDIAVAAATLKDFHGDPADRFIAATAMAGDSVLVTADARLLDWRGEADRRDART